MKYSKLNSYLKCYRRKKNFLKRLNNCVKPIDNNLQNDRQLFGKCGSINFYIRDGNNKNSSLSGEYIISKEPIISETNDSISHDGLDDNDEVVENIYREVEPSSVDCVIDDVNIHIDFMSKLADWAIKYKIAHSAVSELLVLLRSEGKTELPKDARTLLHTPRNVVIQTMGSGSFWYYGIENCLRNAFRDINQTIQVLLNFNVDGLPLFRSSKFQFWPVLIDIANMHEIRPMVVAIYFGDSKPPSSEEFLRSYVDEINSLILNGIEFPNGSKILIKINAYIADTPARAFIKCVKTHTAYNSCTKCNVVGEFDRSGNHMSFPRLDCRRRTHLDFINKVDEDHHLWNSRMRQFYHTPLEEIEGIDMIKNFPIADSMHVIELGITKRCLNGWVNGSYNFRTKMPAYETSTISTWLKFSNEWLPSEITRQARGLDTLSFWKSIEYRTFLLYLGPVIMKSFLPTEFYKHFWNLVLATTIYSCERYVQSPGVLDVARNLMNEYVEEFISLYGNDSISSNVHNLIHVHDDVLKFGSVRNISAYPFESTLYWCESTTLY
ncbi:uncharacterized protein LOC118741800 [Rhagoletis pomonella]|uniref:uncharacterized protein LOC118741800 n=1 Tax=Rhagoletis pomonella TaxID=28610 RepID=UPI00177D5816|nr:uncharacterized protein LOC118741800 [Rhagoletis pomonella]